jgi:hypothetical protein
MKKFIWLIIIVFILAGCARRSTSSPSYYREQPQSAMAVQENHNFKGISTPYGYQNLGIYVDKENGYIVYFIPGHLVAVPVLPGR